MGRSPCCDDNMVIKKGPWTPEEDKKLVEYVNKHGHGSWRALPKLAGLNRCGKSCRLRWANYLRPDIKRGKFSDEEEQLIIKLHSVLGNKWSTIAQRLPGRTDNEIKNYWNTNLRKKLLQRGIDPVTHRPRTDHFNILANLPQYLLGTCNFSTPMNPVVNNGLGIQNTNIADQLAKAQMLNSLLQVLSSSTVVPLPSVGLTMPQLHDNHPLQNYFPDQTDDIITSLEGLANFPVSFETPNNCNHQTQFVSNYSSSLDDVYPLALQTMVESGHVFGDNNTTEQEQFMHVRSAAIWPTDQNSIPPLVSDQLPAECSTMNQMEKLNTDYMSKPASSSTVVDAWEDLQAGDNYWN